MSTGEEGFIHGVSGSWSADSTLYVWIVFQWFRTQPMCLVIRHISSYYGLATRNKHFEQQMYGMKYLTITPDLNPEWERQTKTQQTASERTSFFSILHQFVAFPPLWLTASQKPNIHLRNQHYHWKLLVRSKMIHSYLALMTMKALSIPIWLFCWRRIIRGDN